MDVYEVVKRALADPAFAAELQLAAVKASRSEANSDDWLELQSYFVRSPKELTTLRGPGGAGGAEYRGTTTITTVTTVTTIPCCFTTTTTTTGAMAVRTRDKATSFTQE